MMFNFCSAKANIRPATSKLYAEPQRRILRTSADVPGIGALDAFSETDHKGSAWAAYRDFVGLPWTHSPRVQQLHPLFITTNVSNKSGNLLFAQR
jgi:hypothetical protein